MNGNEGFQAMASRFLERPADDGQLVNDLADAFHRGAPLEVLRDWLRSADEGVLSGAVWIASELGPKAKALLPEYQRLLEHRDREVRFFVLDCVFACAAEADADVLARAALLLQDSDEAVSWKLFKLLTRYPESTLNAASAGLKKDPKTSEYGEAFEWMLSKPSTDDIVARTQSSSPLQRRIALIAAIRAGDDKSLLAARDQSVDETLRELAAEELQARQR